MPHPKIAIVGAGPVGTTLARLLLLQTPSASVTVFESDDSPDYRSQGGTLDLHAQTGLAALKEAGLWEDFLKHARYDGEALKITDKKLKIYHQQEPSGGSGMPREQGSGWGRQERPEIDRGQLRRLLNESLPEGVVRWGHRLKELRPAGHSEKPTDNELVFKVVTSGERPEEVILSGFDLIVGADGGWSKVRSQALSSTKPLFSGIIWHELRIPDAKNTAPKVYAFTNRGSVFAHVDFQKIALQQMGDGSLYVTVMYRAEDETCGFDGNKLDETKKALLERLSDEDWHPLLSEAIAQAQDKAAIRGLYMLPVGFSWAHRQGITILGDAAHLMTPFAGEGVNLGMQDARMLAKGIQAGGEDLDRLDEEVAAFEKDMFKRAGLIQKLADDLMHHWFYTEKSPEDVLPKARATLDKFYREERGS